MRRRYALYTTVATPFTTVLIARSLARSLARCVRQVVVMVDFDLFAAIYFFDNNLAPFVSTLEAATIPLGLLGPRSLFAYVQPPHLC